MYAYGSNTELKKKDVINFLTDLIKSINNDDIIIEDIGTAMMDSTERGLPTKVTFRYHWVNGTLPVIGRLRRENKGE